MANRANVLAVLLTVCVSCATVPPPTTPPELFVNRDSGGDWPVVTSARIYANGTLELGDGLEKQRKRVRQSDPLLTTVLAAIQTPGFAAELAEAATPQPVWRSSGEWIRALRGDTVGLIKPPSVGMHTRSVLEDVDKLFRRTFGSSYQPVITSKSD